MYVVKHPTRDMRDTSHVKRPAERGSVPGLVVGECSRGPRPTRPFRRLHHRTRRRKLHRQTEESCGPLERDMRPGAAGSAVVRRSDNALVFIGDLEALMERSEEP
ncbi:unnamed protein product [Gadus morhua 'NCC']